MREWPRRGVASQQIPDIVNGLASYTAAFVV